MAKERRSEKCRVCLNPDINVKYLSLFEEYNGCTVSDKLNNITNIEVKRGDGLPDTICPDCLLELETAVNFKAKCEKSNLILHSTITVEVDLQKPVVVKEEKHEFLDFEYFDSSALYDDDVKKEDETTVIGRKSRAIDLKLICNDCGESFKSKCKLKVHWKRTHLYSFLLCDICKRQFKSYRALQVHKTQKIKSCQTARLVNIEGVGKSRVFHCRDCDYTSLRIKDIGAHLVLHTGDRPFVCSFCGKGFTQQSSLQTHLEQVHNEYIIETTCQFCGKFIKGRTNLYNHLKQHRSLEVQCDICKKMFKSKPYLRQHIKRHGTIKAFSCEVCAMRFFTASDLSNHRRMIHNKSKKYKCDICNYLAYRADTIKRHRARHTATNVACLLCGIFCENDQAFQVHMKRHLERNFQCPHCESRFNSKKNLYRHIRDKHKCTMLVNKQVNAINVKEEQPEGQFDTGVIISPIMID